MFPHRVLRWTWVDRKFLARLGLEKRMPAFFFTPLWMRLGGLCVLFVGLVMLAIWLFGR